MAASPVMAGIATGLQFNPLVATATAAVSAALVGFPRAHVSRWGWAAAVVLAGWATGDGVRLAASSASAGYLVAWGLAGLLVGYVVPAAAGAAVGRRVVHGTGWLSAIAVAVMVAPALSILAGLLADSIWRFA